MAKPEPDKEPKPAPSVPAKQAPTPKDSIDMFAAKTIFPDAHAVFTSRPKSLEQVKDTAGVVLDTNTLLIPYAIGKQSLDDVRKTYKHLLEGKRLFIPAQVAREFAKHRVNKIADLHSKLCRQQALKPFNQGTYPMLEGVKEYERLQAVEKKIDSLLNEYREALGGVVDKVASWEWNDPVSLLYHELFPQGIIIEAQRPDSEMRAELERRYANTIPPGYKDGAKDDAGIGDLLIWQTILEIGERRKTSILFVTGEEKTDWWHRSEGRTLYPRYELIDEYRRASGSSFHIVKFSQLLGMFDASPTVVAEIRKEELVTSPPRRRKSATVFLTKNSRRAVQQWFGALGYSVGLISQEESMFVAYNAETSMTVDVIFCRREGWEQRLRDRITRLQRRSFENPMLVVVSPSTSICKEALHILSLSAKTIGCTVGTFNEGIFNVMWSHLSNTQPE